MRNKLGGGRARRQPRGYNGVMRRTVSPAPLALTLALLGAGCHHRPAAPLNPRAEVAVTVENQNFLDMDVFLVRSGQRIRLGMVPGLTTRILMVRPELVGYGSELQFEVHPIGARRNPISETMTVHPGDVIHLTIPPS